MKRMIDNKKLKEIEASGGTQWYKHEIKLNDYNTFFFITLVKDAWKDGGLPYGKSVVFLLDAGGPSAPESSTFFHVITKNSSTSIEIKYINSSNQVDTYTLSESNIVSEKVTAL